MAVELYSGITISHLSMKEFWLRELLSVVSTTCHPDLSFHLSMIYKPHDRPNIHSINIGLLIQTEPILPITYLIQLTMQKPGRRNKTLPFLGPTLPLLAPLPTLLLITPQSLRLHFPSILAHRRALADILARKESHGAWKHSGARHEDEGSGAAARGMRRGAFRSSGD